MKISKVSALLIGGLILATVAGCKDSRIERVPQPSAKMQSGMGQTSTDQGGDHPAHEGHPMPNSEGIIIVGPLQMKLPHGWQSQHPSSQMRQAEFILPRAEGDSEDGILAAFYFGPDAGGIEANIVRWYDQFSQPDGSLTEAKSERREMSFNNLKMHFVYFKGDMKPSMMPGAPQTGEKKDWMNVSTIIVTPDGPWFFKGTGPSKTMMQHLPAFEGMLPSVSMVLPS